MIDIDRQLRDAIDYNDQLVNELRDLRQRHTELVEAAQLCLDLLQPFTPAQRQVIDRLRAVRAKETP